MFFPQAIITDTIYICNCVEQRQLAGVSIKVQETLGSNGPKGKAVDNVARQIGLTPKTFQRILKVKTKVLKKYNLTGLGLNPQLSQVHSFSIASREPLYDVDAHPNRVRNVLRAVKVRYPNVHFEHEGCLTSGQCPIGLQTALRKLAMETHGKEAY